MSDQEQQPSTSRGGRGRGGRPRSRGRARGRANVVASNVVTAPLSTPRGGRRGRGLSGRSRANVSAGPSHRRNDPEDSSPSSSSSDERPQPQRRQRRGRISSEPSVGTPPTPTSEERRRAVSASPEVSPPQRQPPARQRRLGFESSPEDSQPLTQAERHLRHRANQDQAEADRRRAVNAANMIRRRAAAAANVNRNIVNIYDRFVLPNEHLVLAADMPRFDENLVVAFSVGNFAQRCGFCRAFHFAGEASPDGQFLRCCRKGTVLLDPPARPYPVFMRELMTDPTDPGYANFRRYIRNYNSALSFASMGANIVAPPGRGPYCFQINGSLYHFMQHLNVQDPANLRYAQIYYLDSTTQATDMRMGHPANAALRRSILREIQEAMIGPNPDQPLNDYIRVLRSAYHLFQDADYDVENAPIGLAFNREFTRADIHQGRQNAPVAQNEIAAVFRMNDDEGVPDFHRDFTLIFQPNMTQQQRDDYSRQVIVNVTSPHLFALTYPLLNPFGDQGWNINWRGTAQGRTTRASMLQFISAETQQRPIRDQNWRPIVHSGNLFQQYAVDSYLKIESDRLNWIRLHQDTLQAAQYRALNDHLQREAQQRGQQAAPAIVLPSTFTGSARNMRQLCIDAMAIFGRCGKPDLFITFTCNPQWPEIISSLGPGEKPHDRPDIVARVFSLKLKELMNDIKKGLLGAIVCFVYTIEFQKRGLPHSHILVTLHNACKPDDAAKIDRLVCAEFPDAVRNQRLHEIVSRCMTHGPCREGLCQEMVDGNLTCRKGFPKPFCNATTFRQNKYPEYRRREFPRQPQPPQPAQPDSQESQESQQPQPQPQPQPQNQRPTTNDFVVPYNPYLTLKYDAHINVEVITHFTSAIKYVYKYVFKGFDCASLIVNRRGELGIDEVRNFISGRYVSAPEAIWRIFEFKMHDRSHTVYRLPLHTDKRDEIEYDEAMETQPAQGRELR